MSDEPPIVKKRPKRSREEQLVHEAVTATIINIAADISGHAYSGAEAAEMILRDAGITKREVRRELSDYRRERVLALMRAKS